MRARPDQTMGGRPLLLGALLALVCVAAPPASAIEITLSAGEFDTEEAIGDGPYEAGVAVRLDSIELVRWGPFTVVPAFGAMTNEDESVYAWAGFAIEIPLGRRFRLTPILAAGAYDRGDGKNLGGVFELRSGLEAAVRPSPRTIVGLEFYHLSNAGFHELNPGTNSLVINVGFEP